MKEKRSRKKIETNLSRALKKVRCSLGLSLIKAEKKTGIHATIINHAENGRRNLDQEFIVKYVTALGLSLDEWENVLKGKKTIYDLKHECIEIVQELNQKQLKMMRVFLTGILVD